MRLKIVNEKAPEIAPGLFVLTVRNLIQLEYIDFPSASEGSCEW